MCFGKSEVYTIQGYFYQESKKAAGSSGFVASGGQEGVCVVLKGK